MNMAKVNGLMQISFPLLCPHVASDRHTVILNYFMNSLCEEHNATGNLNSNVDAPV